MNPLTQAAQDVLAERARQVSAEGWTPDHDDEHREGAMASAAAVYCLCQEGPRKPGEPSELHSSRRWEFNILRAIWPSGWHFNPKDRRQNLVRAAALLLAEIERLDRASGVGVAPAPQCPKGCGLMGTFFDGWRCNHCGETARGVPVAGKEADRG